MSSDQTMSTKAPRRRTKGKTSGPSVSELILKIVSSSKERGGVSLVALKKALAAGGYDAVRNNSRVNLAVKRLVSGGRLLQTKGTGASGSFKTGARAAAKPKKTKRAKRKTAKKPGAKKSPKKTRRASKRGPEKADDTGAAKKTSKPTRAKRRASRSKAKTAKK